MTGQAAAVSNKSYSDYFKWVPVINPALKEDSCKIDYDLLTSRVSAIAKIAFTMLVASIPMSFFSAFGSVVLISMAIVTLSLTYVDSWAAERAADVKAVNEYLQQERPSEGATVRIKSNLSAAQMLVQKKGDLNKANSRGCRVSNYNLEFDVFKCLVDGGMKLNASDLADCVILSNPRFLDYVLKQKKVKASDFTANQQVELWRKLGNQSAGAILAAHGFDVNIRDSEGFTPLLAVVGAQNLSSLALVVQVKTLLKCGADKSLTVAINNNPPKTALELTADPELREAIEKTVQVTPVTKSSCWDSFRSIPVIYPALEQNSCVIDKPLLAYRVAAVAKMSFAMLAIAIPMAAFSPLGSLVLIALSALSHALPRLDSWRAERAADVKAVNEYLQMEHPTKAARERIVANPKLVQLLVKKKGDVNKVDQTGWSFANFLQRLDFDTFKCLVDAGMNIANVFKSIVGLKDPKFLDYVLTQNKVKAADFSEVEKHELWMVDLRHKEAGALLRQHGFSVNSRNRRGFTPLMEAANSWRRAHVKNLLDCGADKSLTVNVRDANRTISKTAMQLTTDTAIQRMLA